MVKYDDPVRIGSTTIPDILVEIKKITRSAIRMKKGGGLVSAAVKSIGMDEFTGGVCRDDKAIYLYIFSNSPLNVTITGIKTYPGRFLRYDRIRDMVVARAALLMETGNILVFDQAIHKVVIRNSTEIDAMDNLIERTRDEFDLVFDGIVESNQVTMTPSEASSWMVRAYHNYRRSADILSSFEEMKPTVWSLYISIAEYYSRMSISPHMQWWNIATAEKLIRNPSEEVEKSRKFLKLAGENNETGLSSENVKSKPVVA